MNRSIEKNEYDLEKARRECDVWKTTRGGEHNYSCFNVREATF